MAEVLDSVPKEHLERLVDEIIASRITASAPQSNGISRAYSIAVQIGETREIVDEMINTKAGEKSSEMLINVKLG